MQIQKPNIAPVAVPEAAEAFEMPRVAGEVVQVGNLFADQSQALQALVAGTPFAIFPSTFSIDGPMLQDASIKEVRFAGVPTAEEIRPVLRSLGIQDSHHERVLAHILSVSASFFAECSQLAHVNDIYFELRRTDGREDIWHLDGDKKDGPGFDQITMLETLTTEINVPNLGYKTVPEGYERGTQYFPPALIPHEELERYRAELLMPDLGPHDVLHIETVFSRRLREIIFISVSAPNVMDVAPGLRVVHQDGVNALSFHRSAISAAGQNFQRLVFLGRAHFPDGLNKGMLNDTSVE